jgi:hypothetical protein
MKKLSEFLVWDKVSIHKNIIPSITIPSKDKGWRNTLRFNKPMVEKLDSPDCVEFFEKEKSKEMHITASDKGFPLKIHKTGEATLSRIVLANYLRKYYSDPGPFYLHIEDSDTINHGFKLVYVKK